MSNLVQRILSAIVLIPVVLALIIWAPAHAFACFIALIAALAGFEFGDITIGREFPGHRFLVATLAAMICAGIYLSTEFTLAPLIAVVLVVPAASVSFMLDKSDLSRSVPAAAHSIAGALYAGALFGCITLIFATADPFGRYWVILLAAGTFVGDTMAYACGRAFGKRKLAPRISPGKTWAGAVGGGIGTMGCVALAKATLLPGLEWIDIVLLGVPLAAACQFGDLAESFVKRGFGAKDSGRLIPGHGGILDRCDGLMMGAPVVYLFSFLR
ncbi:MAG: phosphatidate cytidylyltransferase [Deltaproteobacteria bacterium]|nr:phosphatidate cytidylyltransferase [Deltaproteobacteria bacterium]